MIPMRNNNREIIRLLAFASYKKNRGRNRILIGAVAFVVITLFGVFSLSIGKIEADYLLYLRTSGTSAYTTLERPTDRQIKTIEGLSYIKETGKSVYLGSTDVFTCEVLDKNAYETMQLPAYTDVHGDYPSKENEIMLPIRALKETGIENPKLNMKIPVKLTLDSGETIKKEFRLSGFYTEYVDPSVAPPRGFCSQQFLDSLPVDVEMNSLLLMQQNDTLEDEQIEQKLYDDVPMRDDTQQFFGGNSMSYQSVYDLAGGLDTAFLLTVVILLGAYLLLNNVLQISLNRDIRQYGLLKTLGTTKGQLRRIVYRQVTKTVLWGSGMGVVIGSAVTLLIIPKLLSSMYLHGLGNASTMIAFKPWILIFAVTFGAVVTFLSASMAMRKVIKMSPVEAAKFTEQRTETKEKEKKTTKGGAIAHMAWRNIFRFRRRFCITVLSLVLGITISLCAIVLSKGTDQTNQINYENSDFSIISHMNAMQVENYSDDDVFIKDDFKEKIEDLAGIEEEVVVHGGYGRVFSDEKALTPRIASWGYDKKTSFAFVVQALSDDILKQIKSFAEEEGLTVDVDRVLDGNGFMILHYHNLSRIMTEKSEKTIGMPLNIYNLAGEQTGTLSCSGYLDFTKKGLPKFKTTWNGSGILYLLTSEEGFQKMNLTEQTFGIELNVRPELEPLLKNQLNLLITDYNKTIAPKGKLGVHTADKEMILFNAKSDVMEEAKDYLTSSRIVMGALCTILILMGLVNYVNVTMTGLALRRKEFAVMESIGLTRRQLRKLLLIEGIFYSLVVTVATMIFGSGLLFALKWIMNQRIAYFVFSYPWGWLAVCIAGIFSICISVPLLMYKKAEKESVIERLRYYTD